MFACCAPNGIIGWLEKKMSFFHNSSKFFVFAKMVLFSSLSCENLDSGGVLKYPALSWIF